MKYISDLTVGGSVNDIYLCRKKTTALTKAGKEYESLDLQDKTGNCDGKIWEPGSMGIDDYNEMDYVFVTGEVTELHLQLSFHYLKLVANCPYIFSKFN